MKKYFEAETADDLYLQLIEAVAGNPEYTASPRGMHIKEITGVVAKINNPVHNLITFKSRKLNYAFSAVEKLQYLSGVTDPECLIYYNGNFANFKNAYGFFDGAYPERLSYWYKHVYELLKADPDTRQAVMSIYGVQDRHKSADIPCTVMFQFLLRNGKLNMISYMRSNDLLWGFPYDTSGFCFIQQTLAAMLKVEVGTYELHAGSLHLYTEREDQLTRLMTSQDKHDFTLPVIPHYDSIEALRSDLSLFWVAERDRRVNGVYNMDIVAKLPNWLAYYYHIVDDYITSKTNTKLFN